MRHLAPNCSCVAVKRPTNTYDCGSGQLPGVNVDVKQGDAQKKHLCSANLASINKCFNKKLRLRGAVRKRGMARD